MGLPETREIGAEIIGHVTHAIEQDARHQALALNDYGDAILALARLGLEAAFPTEETKKRLVPVLAPYAGGAAIHAVNDTFRALRSLTGEKQ